jgi:hypothetical protein
MTGDPLEMLEPRELVGRLVHQVWLEWMKEQLGIAAPADVPWENLAGPLRELFMRIGAALFEKGRDAGMAGG